MRFCGVFIVALKKIMVYRTTVVEGKATVSERFELEVNDTNNDGIITRDEWVTTTADVPGHIGGSVGGAPALWDGTTGATNASAEGFLYTAAQIPTTAPDNLTVVQAILSDITHAPKYAVSVAGLTICFLAGTLITTADGPRAVETLRAGDLVMTRDHGPQPLVWVGQSVIDAARLDSNPNLRPIVIGPGALGGGAPRRMLAVSAQHRMVIRDGAGAEYLVAARHLQAAGMADVHLRTGDEPFTLVHIACAGHEVIDAEGAAAETFFPGPMAIHALDPAQRATLFRAFPTLAHGENPMQPARPFLKKAAVAKMIAGSSPAVPQA